MHRTQCPSTLLIALRWTLLCAWHNRSLLLAELDAVPGSDRRTARSLDASTGVDASTAPLDRGIDRRPWPA